MGLSLNGQATVPTVQRAHRTCRYRHAFDHAVFSNFHANSDAYDEPGVRWLIVEPLIQKVVQQNSSKTLQQNSVRFTVKRPSI